MIIEALKLLKQIAEPLLREDKEIQLLVLTYLEQIIDTLEKHR
jgi:hypothetical protein